MHWSRAASFGAWSMLFIAVGLLVYAPALAGGFIWDDEDIYIVRNALLPEPDGLFRFWFTTEPLDYYPLAYSTFWFEYRLWGPNTFGYHCVNVVIHALGVVGLWWTLKQLGLPGAWSAAALFLIHPVNVESVAWISQRKTLLGGALAFWSVGFWLSGRRSWSLAFFVLSLAGKPVAIALPVWLLVHAWWSTGRIPNMFTRRTLWSVAPFFAASVVFGVVGLWFQQVNVIRSEAVRGDGLWERLLVACWTLWFYAGTGLAPFGLCFVYPRWKVDGTWISVLWAILSVLPVSLLFWQCCRLRTGIGRHMLFGLAWFVLMVLPASGLVDVFYWRYSFVGDHYQYPALAATTAALAGFGVYFAKKISAPPVVQRLAAVSLLVGWSAISIRLADDYQNAERLWRATLRKNPAAWLAHTNLAMLLVQKQEQAEAFRHYEAALVLRPDLAESHNNIGMVFSARGRSVDAAAAFREADRLRPNDVQFLHNLGVELSRLNATDESLQLLRRSAELEEVGRGRKGRFIKPLAEYGYLLARLGREEEAEAAFAKAVEASPASPLPWIGRAYIREARKDWAGAEQLLRKAVGADPRSFEALVRLAESCERQKKDAEALGYFERAAEVDPQALTFVAWMLAASPTEAIRDPKRALLIAEQLSTQQKVGAGAWDVYAVALAANGRFTEAVSVLNQAIQSISANSADAADPTVQATLERLRSRARLFSDRRPLIGRIDELTPR